MGEDLELPDEVFGFGSWLLWVLATRATAVVDQAYAAGPARPSRRYGVVDGHPVPTPALVAWLLTAAEFGMPLDRLAQRDRRLDERHKVLRTIVSRALAGEPRLFKDSWLHQLAAICGLGQPELHLLARSRGDEGYPVEPEALRKAIGQSLRTRPADDGALVLAGATVGETQRVRSGSMVQQRQEGPADSTADLLAEVVGEQWTRAAADRRLLHPEPIPVRWGMPAQPLAGPVSAAASSRQFPPLPRLATLAEHQLQQGGLEDLHAIYGGLGSGRMIIAGGPGSGKTGAALLLLLAALKHREQVSAEDRPLVPVPVLFTLHGWNPRTQRFQDWLTFRLQQAYPLFAGRGGRARALALVRGGKLALILDGLDEIPADLRPVALRSLSQQAVMRLVLLTRSAEMAAAAQQSLLAGAVALELRPIGSQTAADYLARVQLDPAPAGWRELIGRLRHGAGGPLGQALSSPLALTLVRDTYRSADDVRELLDLCDSRGPGLSREEIEDHLLDRVLPAAYEPAPGEPRPRYDLAAAQRALGYLAARMNQDGTRDLAWWHTPAWVPRNPRFIMTGLLVGSLTGLLTGLAIGVVAGRRAGVIAGLVAGHGTGLVIGLVVGIGTGLMAGPGAELVSRARSRTVSGSPQQIASPRWRPLFAPGALGTGLVAGLAVGLGLGAGFGARFGLVGGVGFAVGAWLVAGLVQGLSRPVAVDANPLDPLASWRADKAFGRLAGLLAGVLAGLLTGTVVGVVAELGAAIVVGEGAGQGLAVGLVDGLVAGLGAGLGVGLAAALTYPDTWAASLSFAQLASRWRTPLRLMRFLEDAHQRDVLRAVGPIYQFRHARLQDRLASKATRAAIPAAQPARPQILPRGRSAPPSQRDHLRRLGWIWGAGALIAFSLTPVVAFAPKAPGGVSAAALGQYRIRVTWAASQYATGYRIDNGCPISDGGACGRGASLAKTTGPVTTAEFAVTPGTRQCFEVQAFDALGTSGWSNLECASTRPLFVPGTRAWTDSGVTVPAGITLGIIANGTMTVRPGYSVSPSGNQSCIPGRDHPGVRFPAPHLRCWSLIARIGKGAPFEVGISATVTTTSGRLYLGVNSGSFSHDSGGWTADIQEGGWSPPDTAPVNVSAAALGQYKIAVSWTGSPVGVTGFHIDNGCPPGTCQPGATLTATTRLSTWSFSVTPGTYQCFRVRAFNSSGAGPWSGYGCTTTPGLVLQGTQKWTDTGITLKSGDIVGFAANGTVNIGPSNVQSPRGKPSCRPAVEYSAASSTFPAPYLPCWSLIGRIGNGHPFEIGSSAMVTATAGRLYLGINTGNSSGNSGSWIVNMKIGGMPPPPS